MNILMLVNWKIEYAKEIPEDRQPPDYYVRGTPYWFFRYFQNKEETQVDVIDIRSFPWFEKLEQNKLHFYVWQTLKCIPKLKKYDLVLSHGMQSGIVLCLWRRLFGKGKYKHIVFDIGAFNSGKEEGGALSLMQFASKTLDGVIYHTRVQKKYYEKYHPWLVDRSEFILFGTDPEYFAQQKDLGEEDMNRGGRKQSESRNSYILCVGSNKRDWDTLIRAYEELKTDVPLRLIGNGELKAENPKVEIIARVGIAELKKQMENALFCVVPLQSFPYSYGQMTLLQQMALGKAVIVADVPSVEAYLKEGALLWYEPENVKMLREKMRKLIDDSELRGKLGRQAEYLVRTEFNERNMAGEIERVIGGVMEKSKKA